MYGFILQWMCGFASAFSPSSTVTKELLEKEPDCLWDRFTNGSGVSPPQKYWWAWWAAVPHTGTAPWLTSSAKWQNFQERSEKLTWGLLFLINASDRWHTIRSHNSWDFPILRDMLPSRTQTSARLPPEELPPTINGNLKQNQGQNPPPPAKHSSNLHCQLPDGRQLPLFVMHYKVAVARWALPLIFVWMRKGPARVLCFNCQPPLSEGKVSPQIEQ